MQLNPYLLFDGNCKAAFTFYEKVFGGKIEMMMTHADAPAEHQVSAEWRDKILHARLSFSGGVLMASDAPAGRFEKPQGFSLSIAIDDPAEAERLFNALVEKGKVTMPFGQTFWAYRFGMLVDQFGIPWMINCEKAA